MWRGHETALATYMAACISEWVHRGFRNTMVCPVPTGSYTEPSWLGDDAVHAAYRSNLLRKDPTWYGQFGWTEPDNLPYIWPVWK